MVAHEEHSSPGGPIQVAPQAGQTRLAYGSGQPGAMATNVPVGGRPSRSRPSSRRWQSSQSQLAARDWVAGFPQWQAGVMGSGCSHGAWSVARGVRTG